MLKILLSILFYLTLGLHILFSQSSPEATEFIPPLNIPLKLSGTFGELRTGHFHSGIDLKTGEIEGLNIYAIDDGYISRIKIQSGGYGKALYISHPSGFTSVYGHLKSFSPEIEKFVRKEQYSRKSYTIDLYLQPDQFPVLKEDVIALSGNTGRSGGPHLHFEIRETASQKPMNPLFFGFNVIDNLPPIIRRFKVYPMGNDSYVEGKTNPGTFSLSREGNTYSLAKKDTISVAGAVYFAINTVDLFNNGQNKNGVFRISYTLDGRPFYVHELSSFSFDETRYIYSLIDYADMMELNSWMQKTRVEPNNQLSIYKTADQNGIVSINPDQTNEVECKVEDFAGNQTTLSFVLKGVEPSVIAKEKSAIDEKDQIIFSYNTNNTFKTRNLVLDVPGKALYDTLAFTYSNSPRKPNQFSKLHHIHNPSTPLHSWCKLSIWPEDAPEDVLDKLVIVRIDEDDEYVSEGGDWVDGFIQTNIRDFGDYCIMADTLAPVINPLNISEGKSLLAQNTIQVKITDEMAGIDSYYPTLNSNWILMEYDEKSDRIIYYIDEHIKDGENAFELKVTDKKGNTSKYSVTLIY